MVEDLSHTLGARVCQYLSLHSRLCRPKSQGGGLAVENVEDVNPLLTSKLFQYVRQVLRMYVPQAVLGDGQSDVSLGGRQVGRQGLDVFPGDETLCPRVPRTAPT